VDAGDDGRWRVCGRSRAAMCGSVAALVGSDVGSSGSTHKRLRCGTVGQQCGGWSASRRRGAGDDLGGQVDSTAPYPLFAALQQWRGSWCRVPVVTRGQGWRRRSAGGKVRVAVWEVGWPQQLPLPFLSPLWWWRSPWRRRQIHDCHEWIWRGGSGPRWPNRP
jgi:hypothetical protein